MATRLSISPKCSFFTGYGHVNIWVKNSQIHNWDETPQTNKNNLISTRMNLCVFEGKDLVIGEECSGLDIIDLRYQLK